MDADIPLVSVIIPTYNRAHWVGRVIRGVLDQTYHNFESGMMGLEFTIGMLAVFPIYPISGVR